MDETAYRKREEEGKEELEKVKSSLFLAYMSFCVRE
jgi:hypothetical protein